MGEPVPKAQLWAQVRWGRVSSVNADQHTVQVQFEEIDGFVSGDFGVLAMRPGDYALPPKDALVLCLLMDTRLAEGFVLGAFYSEKDAAPLSDAGQRSIASDDLRLGDPDAEDKVALAPKVNDNDTALWNVLNDVCGNTAAVINEAGNGGPSSLQAAFKLAIAAQQLANKLPPVDVAAEKVKAK
jgi:phage baseplate assembly protein gpV